MNTYQLKTKRLAVQVIKKGKPIGHPIYVEKSVLMQLWEKYIFHFLLLAIGITIGVIFE